MKAGIGRTVITASNTALQSIKDLQPQPLGSGPQTSRIETKATYSGPSLSPSDIFIDKISVSNSRYKL